MANEKIRIGNDIDIRWSLVDGDGNPYNMEGKDISIEIVVNDSKRVRIKQFTVSGNTLHFIYYGKDQKYLGSCDLKYIENDGKVEMVTFDTQAAFTMVPHSWLAVDADEQPERVYLEYTTVVSQLVDIGHGHIDIDDHLDLESENPVQNKVITAAILTLEISEIPEAGATPEELDEIGLTREVLIDLCDGKYKWVKVGGENYAVVNSVPIDETAGLDGNVIFADTQIFVPADEVYLPFVQKLVIDPESTSNKVTSLSASSTDVQYPSAKAVHNAVAGMLKYTSQNLTEAQKEQARTNVNAAKDSTLISSAYMPPAGKNNGKTAAQMAQLLGISTLQLDDLFAGKYTAIKFETMLITAAHMDTSLGYFIFSMGDSWFGLNKSGFGGTTYNSAWFNLEKEENKVTYIPQDADHTQYPSALAVKNAISDFVTKSVNDLVNYYLKDETYTRAEVEALIAAIQGFSYEVVAELPTASASTMGKIYLVPSSDPQTQNVKDEYITIDNGSEAQTRYTWEQIGSTAIDLSGYVTISALNAALADYTTTTDLTTLLSSKEDKSNKVTSFGSTPSDDKYPSEKLVKDSLDGKQDVIDSTHKLPYSLLSETPPSVPTPTSSDKDKVLGVTDNQGTLGWIEQSSGIGATVSSEVLVFPTDTVTVANEKLII